MSIINVSSAADNGSGSLRNAIAQAQSGDTIQFDPSLAAKTITLTSGQLTVNKDLTVDGAGASGLTISGNNASRIFDVSTAGSNFTLRNLTLANGKATGTWEDGAGGAIRTPSADKLTTLNVENSKFLNNSSSGAGGGAIWAGFNTANTITGSTFDGNDSTAGKSERGGGAVAVNTNSTLTVKGSNFTNNKGTNGGALNSVLTKLTVEDSTFRNNDSTAGGPIGPDTIGYGGAIYTDGANASGANYDHGPNGGTITIRNSDIENNKAAGQGGGLFLYAYPPDKVIVENSKIIKNEVIPDSKGDSLGGGLRIGNSEFTVNNTTFSDNHAFQQGGGLWVGEQSPGTITKSTFTGNRAESSDGKSGIGGGIALANYSNPVTIDGTTVPNNYASNDSTLGANNGLIAANPSDKSLGNATSGQTTGNNSNTPSSSLFPVNTISNNTNGTNTPVDITGNSTNSNSDGSLTPDLSGTNSQLCGNLTLGDNLYNTPNQQNFTQGKGTDNFTLTPGHISELTPNLNSGKDYTGISLLDGLKSGQLASSQPRDSLNVDNTQRHSLTNLQGTNTSVSNPQSGTGQLYPAQTL